MVKLRLTKPYNALEPLSIVESVSAQFYFNADLSTTISTGVSQWNDQSGNGRHATQGTGSLQPTLVASALNNKNYITFDGTDDVLSLSYIPPAPGTTPSWYWIVFNPISAVTSATIIGSNNTNRHRFYWANTSLLSMNNTTGVNSGTVTTNAWYRGEIFFNNNTTDYRKVGSTSVTGANAGNNAGSTGTYLGAMSASLNATNVSIAACGLWAGQPTAAEKTALDIWVFNYYGGTVSI